MHRILYVGNEASQHADAFSRRAFGTISDIASRSLTATGEAARLTRPPYESSIRHYASDPIPPIPQEVNREVPPVRRGGRRERRRAAADVLQQDLNQPIHGGEANFEHGDPAETTERDTSFVTPQHLVFDTRYPTSADEFAAGPSTGQSRRRHRQSEEGEGPSHVTEEEDERQPHEQPQEQPRRRVQPPRNRRGFHCGTSFHPFIR